MKMAPDVPAFASASGRPMGVVAQGKTVPLAVHSRALNFPARAGKNPGHLSPGRGSSTRSGFAPVRSRPCRFHAHRPADNGRTNADEVNNRRTISATVRLQMSQAEVAASAFRPKNPVCCSPILRHSHQIPATKTKQMPSGSGTRNAPQVARAIGDLISRTLMMGTACSPSGGGKS